MPSYIDTLNSFDVHSLPNLDVVVMGALELFTQNGVEKLDIPFKRPLVVGSGNAEATGKILFSDSAAVTASESSYTQKLATIADIDGVVIVSASGAKHAPIIARTAVESGKKVVLLTATPNSETSQLFGNNPDFKDYVLPKNREPYTYNTSTYMGMILAKTGEDASAIKSYIETTVDQIALPDFSKYQKYFMVVPPEFSGITRMLQVKFIELFGREVARDVETSEYMRHATTVVPSDQELFISFGEENTIWGTPENRLFIPLPENADYAAMMAIGYYTVGKIQAHYEHMFKDNIVNYTTEASKLFGSTITPIVEN